MKNVKKLYLKILNKLYNLYKHKTTMIQTNFTQQSTTSIEPTGTWINMKTGETITVKTMVNDMSGNGSQLMLTDGRLMSFAEFSNNYVQMEEDSTNPSNDISNNIDNINNTTSSNTPKLNIDLLTSGLGQDNNNITNNKLESFDSPYETPFVNIEGNENSTTPKPKRINLDNNINTINTINTISNNNISINNSCSVYTKQQNIVKEFLNNLEKQPTINFKSIYIENMPTEPISTFVKYLGVTKEDIVDVLYKELCKEDVIKSILTNYINNILEDKNYNANNDLKTSTTQKPILKTRRGKI